MQYNIPVVSIQTQNRIYQLGQESMRKISFLLIVILLLLTSCGQSEPNTPEEFVKEYGGNQDVYVNILALTDCEALQEEFNTASDNNARETAGTPEFRWTLGYMKAADYRMKEISCYQ